MHEALRKVHHLKNGARLQYGVFLKLIGISYDSQVDFFKEEFLKTMDICTFENSYLYYIQHIYGKVGRRIEYKSFTCKPIIQSKVGFGEYHGCPYKNMTEETLRINLKKMGIEDEGNFIYYLFSGLDFFLLFQKISLHFDCIFFSHQLCSQKQLVIKIEKGRKIF